MRWSTTAQGTATRRSTQPASTAGRSSCTVASRAVPSSVSSTMSSNAARFSNGMPATHHRCPSSAPSKTGRAGKRRPPASIHGAARSQCRSRPTAAGGAGDRQPRVPLPGRRPGRWAGRHGLGRRHHRGVHRPAQGASATGVHDKVAGTVVVLIPWAGRHRQLQHGRHPGRCHLRHSVHRAPTPLRRGPRST